MGVGRASRPASMSVSPSIRVTPRSTFRWRCSRPRSISPSSAFNASVDKGPWTWAVALVHGFGKVSSSRDTGFGFATAGYNAALDGALTELSYYWSLDQSRIVPKAAFEYVRASTGSLQEIGGLDPVTATGATAERARILIGAEVGRYWIFDQKIFDLSAYGKFVDNSCRISARSRSASVPRASSCRGSAKASMAPMPAPRLRSA